MMNKRTFVIEGSLIAVQPLATCSKDLLDREGEKNQPTPIPSTSTGLGKRLMFPSTGIRGAWRRACRDVLRNRVIALTGNPKPFSLDEHYYLTEGGIKGEGEMDRVSVAAEGEWRIKNPLLSLLGAGDAGCLGFVAGNLSVGNAVCKEPCEPQIFSGARTDEFYRNTDQVQYLSEEDLNRLVMRAKGGKVRTTITAEIKSLDKEAKKLARTGKLEEEAQVRLKITDLEAQLAANKESSGTSSNSIGMPLAGYKAIPEGSELLQRLILRQTDLVELGLLVETLNQFARFPILGAHYANGCGLVSGKWEFFEVLESGVDSVGTVSFEPFFPLEVKSDLLVEARKAFNTAMDSNTFDLSIPKAS